MTAIQVPVTDYSCIQPTDDFSRTGVASEKTQTSEQDNSENWEGVEQEIIDKLIEWSTNPGQLSEDDWESPSIVAISKSYELICWLRKNRLDTPSQVVSSGEAGIVFENDCDTFTESIEVDSDGTTEYRRFKNCRLVDRREILIS